MSSSTTSWVGTTAKTLRKRFRKRKLRHDRMQRRIVLESLERREAPGSMLSITVTALLDFLADESPQNDPLADLGLGQGGDQKKTRELMEQIREAERRATHRNSGNSAKASDLETAPLAPLATSEPTRMQIETSPPYSFMEQFGQPFQIPDPPGVSSELIDPYFLQQDLLANDSGAANHANRPRDNQGGFSFGQSGDFSLPPSQGDGAAASINVGAGLDRSPSSNGISSNSRGGAGFPSLGLDEEGNLHSTATSTEDLQIESTQTRSASIETTTANQAANNSQSVRSDAAARLDSVVTASRGGPSAPVLNFVHTLSRRGNGQLFVEGQVDIEARVGTSFDIEFVSIAGNRASSLDSIHLTKEVDGPVDFTVVVDGKLNPGHDFVALTVGTFAGAGAVSLPYSVTNGNDRDRDDIDSEIESRGPNDGDGNRDGVADSRQRDVASLPNAANGRFLTISGKGRALGALGVSRAAEHANAHARLPHGLVSFEVYDVDPGGIAEVEIVLPEGSSPGTYYKEDPATGELAEFTFNGSTGALIDGNVVTLYLQDGGRGDADGVANGVILDPGGAGGNVVTVPCTNPNGLEGWTVTESGGTPGDAGTVTIQDGEIILTEGNSFLVTAETDIVIPEDPHELLVDFLETFDLSDDFINDSFEIALVDDDGLPVVPVFARGSDAFFNFTEEQGPQPVTEDTPQGRGVRLDIATLPAGATYRLVLRLVNNDTDTTSVVTVGCSREPVAFDDNYAMTEDDTLVKDAANGILANDTDPDFDELEAVLVSPLTPTGSGDLLLAKDGSFTFTPEPDFFGVATFTYKAVDEFYESNEATVTITVAGVPDPPFALDDEYPVLEGGTLNVPVDGVLNNDGDVDNDSITAIQLSNVSNGNAVLAGDGSFSYTTPDADFFGTVTFTYKVNDGTFDSNEATVTIDVMPVNDPPIAADDPSPEVGPSYVTDEDEILNVPNATYPDPDGVLANDEDIDSPSITARNASDPANGSVILSPNGSFQFTPAPDWFGETFFTYQAYDGELYSNTVTVDITVNPVNDPPTPDDDIYEVDEDLLLDVTAALGVLFGDIDVDGDPVTAQNPGIPSHGTLTSFNPDGSFTYQPDQDYFGPDEFTYEASDPSGAFTVATVSITVDPVNDPPTGEPDVYTTDEDTTLATIAAVNGVLVNDSDIDTPHSQLTAVPGPLPSGLTFDPDGSFTYTPPADFNTAPPSTPVTFTYQVHDGELNSSDVTVTIHVNPVSDRPIAYGESYTALEDVLLEKDALAGVLANGDYDPDGNAVIAERVGDPTNGQLTEFNTDGSFKYQANPEYSGPDSFTYKVFDGSEYSDVVTVNLTVDPVNDPPDTLPESYEVNEDESLYVNAAEGVLANDSDRDSPSFIATEFGRVPAMRCSSCSMRTAPSITCRMRTSTATTRSSIARTTTSITRFPRPSPSK